MDETRNKSQKRKKIRRVAVKFYIFAFGFLLSFSPFIAVIGLQSSVNIEDGLGTLSLGVAYLVSFLFAIFCTPSLIRRFGCKWAFVTAETTYLLYVAANYHPISYVIFTVGVLLGIGDAVIWTVLQMYNVHFGRLQTKLGSRDEEYYVRKYVGHFFAIFKTAEVLGNGISYAVLYGGKNKNTTSTPNVTGEVTDRYEHCGANDCQDPNITDTNIEQYVPTSMISFYILVTVYCCMCIAGLAMHARFLPNIGGRKRIEEKECVSAENKAHQDAIVLDQQKINVQHVSARKTLAATFRQVILPKQLLITPVSIYFGFVITFGLSEVTRAYSSCIVGVEQVGLGLMTYASASAVTSFSASRIIGILGQPGLVIATFVLDACNFLLCLLWRPQGNDAFVVYLIFLACGISNGSWQNTIIGMYSKYFPENPEIVYTVWNTLVTIGFGIANTYSSLLCVSTKLYFLLGWGAFSAVCYGIVEYMDRVKQKK